jgi:hypothetical protein
LFGPLLDLSLSGDISWYEDNQRRLEFCNFLAAQHMRTRAVKERTIQRLKNRMKLDISRIWDVLALLFSFNVGSSLFLQKNRRALLLLSNKTRVPFATSDQPVINIYGNGDTPPEKLSFFYPISPSSALYLAEPDEVTDISFASMAENTVRHLNLRVAQASHSQVYAQTLEPLEFIRAELVSTAQCAELAG